jgi:hypothetical protein
MAEDQTNAALPQAEVLQAESPSTVGSGETPPREISIRARTKQETVNVIDILNAGKAKRGRDRKTEHNIERARVRYREREDAMEPISP